MNHDPAPMIASDHPFPAFAPDSQTMRLISHELRTPLTAIMGYAELLLDRRIDRRTTREFADSILSQATRLRSVIDGLLALSQLQTPGESHPAACAMDVLVQDVVDAIQQAARDRAYQIALDGPGIVTIDPFQAEQVVNRLLANAAAFSPETEPITIASSSEDGWWTLAVADRGPGIPATMQERVFDRFTRVGAPAIADREGVGLGLAIVRETARRYGGDAWTADNPGGGTVVFVRLPLDAGDAADIRHDAE